MFFLFSFPFVELDHGTIEVGNLLQTKHNDWINKKIRNIVTFFNSE